MNQSNSTVCVAVDIGGTKIRGGLINAQGQLLHGVREPTDASRGSKNVLTSIEAACNQLLLHSEQHALHVRGIGVSSCGVIDPVSGKVVSSAPAIPGWEGTELGRILHSKFALPVAADNDANCALVGEAWLGSVAKDTNAVTLMFTLGTGLGGAMMVGDKLVTGKHHVTGHFGIAKLWEPTLGHNVPTEWLVSGSGLANIYRSILSQSSASDAVGGEAVMDLAKAGGAHASQALSIWLDHLAQLIENYYWMLDPHTIIIGGGVIHSRDVWWPGLVSRLALRGVPTVIAQAKLGNDAGIFGAAKLFFDRVSA